MGHIFHIFEHLNQQQYVLKPASIRDRVIAQFIDGIFLGIICSGIFYYFSNGQIYSIWVSPMFPQFLLQVESDHLTSASDFWWGGSYFLWNLSYGKAVYINYPAPMLWGLYGLYYTIFAAQTGQTPGKMMKKLVVLDESRNRVDYGKALLRWACYLLSLLPFGIGFWWGFKEENQRTWHDLFANTFVYSFEEK